MGEHVSVSWQGMGQLISLTNDQYLNVSEASGFMCSGQLADTGAFSGFLSIFKDSYTDALTAVTDSLGEAITGTRDLSSRIESVRDDLLRTDTGVSELGTRLTARVEAGPTYAPPGANGVPQVNDNVVNANNVLDVDTPMSGPKPPGWVPGAGTGDPIDLIDNLMSLAENADATDSALDHADDMDDYLEKDRP